MPNAADGHKQPAGDTLRLLFDGLDTQSVELAALFQMALTARRIVGTARVAIGDRRSIGGDVSSPMPIDMIFDHATVAFDGRPALADGRLAGA